MSQKGEAPGALRRKLDARGRRALERAELPGTIEVLMRTDGEPSEEQKAALAAAGCRVQFTTGNVVTGRIETGRLEAVAALPFVRRIEVSRPLYEEQGG